MPANPVPYPEAARSLLRDTIVGAVDHLARTIHGRGSTAVLLQAACEATGCQPGTVITATHDLVRWEMPRLLTVFLDCPTHMTR